MYFFQLATPNFLSPPQSASPPSRALSLQCSACHRWLRNAQKQGSNITHKRFQNVPWSRGVGASRATRSIGEGVCGRRRKWCGQAVSCRRLFGVVLGSVHQCSPRSPCKTSKIHGTENGSILADFLTDRNRRRRRWNVRLGSSRFDCKGLKLTHTCFNLLLAPGYKTCRYGRVAPSAIPEHTATRFNLRRHTRGPSTALPLARVMLVHCRLPLDAIATITAPRSPLRARCFCPALPRPAR
jgi:hypothetical protein